LSKIILKFSWNFLVISEGYSEGFQAEFKWTGTRDMRYLNGLFLV
jgi:hypothetical protein